MKSTLIESILAATRRCSLSGWGTAHLRRAIVRGLIVTSLALATGCAYDGAAGGGYYYGGGGVYLDGDFADGRSYRAFHEDRQDGHFGRGHEGGFERGHEVGHEGGFEGGHEGGLEGGHEGGFEGGHEGGEHGGGGHR
jgi:hypothetical protein